MIRSAGYSYLQYLKMPCSYWPVDQETCQTNRGRLGRLIVGTLDESWAKLGAPIENEQLSALINIESYRISTSGEAEKGTKVRAKANTWDWVDRPLMLKLMPIFGFCIKIKWIRHTEWENISTLQVCWLSFRAPSSCFVTIKGAHVFICPLHCGPV